MSKNRTILQQLFQGGLFPAETMRNPEWKKIISAISTEREYLSGQLYESNRARLQKIEDLYQEYNNIYGEECFACGFRLGALLLIEVFNTQTDAFEQTGVSG